MATVKKGILVRAGEWWKHLWDKLRPARPETARDKMRRCYRVANPEEVRERYRRRWYRS